MSHIIFLRFFFLIPQIMWIPYDSLSITLTEYPRSSNYLEKNYFTVRLHNFHSMVIRPYFWFNAGSTSCNDMHDGTELFFHSNQKAELQYFMLEHAQVTLSISKHSDKCDLENTYRVYQFQRFSVLSFSPK